MSLQIRPLATYVVAKQEEKAKQTASGILLTDSANEKTDTLIVETVANDVKTVHAGDKIIAKSYAGTTITIEGVEHTLLKEEDIVGVITEKGAK